MEQWKSVDEVLSFAIREEEASVVFYERLAKRAESAAIAGILMVFAKEEQAHKEKLLAVKAGKDLESASEQVLALKAADYVVDAVPAYDMKYRDALTVAIAREEAAAKLYTHLAARADHAKIRDLFMALARQEAWHKQHFETEWAKYHPARIVVLPERAASTLQPPPS
jgi:rubrerythrin